MSNSVGYRKISGNEEFKMSSLQLPPNLHRQFTAMLALQGVTKTQIFTTLVCALLNGDIKIMYDPDNRQKVHANGDLEKYYEGKIIKLYTSDGILINPTATVSDDVD